MTNTVYALAAATFCNVVGSGIVLIDVSALGGMAAVVQIIVGFVALLFAALGAALLVIAGRTPA